MISASLFGHSSGIYDAFITAWRVPNLFRKLLGEGALSVALQEGVTEADGKEGLEAGAALFQATIRLVFAILLLVCGAGMVIAWCLPDTMPFTGAEWLDGAKLVGDTGIILKTAADIATKVALPDSDSEGASV